MNLKGKISLPLRRSFLVRLFLCCLFLSAFLRPIQAQNFLWNDRCEAAFDEAIALKRAPAYDLIAAERAANPENLIPHLLENYLDFFESFIGEQEANLRAFEVKVDKRLSQFKTADDQSPWKRYCQAEVQLQLAIARLKFDEYFSAFWEVRRAYKLLKENQRKFPEFYPNLKSLGYIHALIGTVPDNYKWGLRILGLEGDLRQGMGELKAYIDACLEGERYFYDEAIGLYSFFLIYLEKDFDGARTMMYEALDDEENLLHVFLRSDLAFRLGETDLAIELLARRPKGGDYLDFHFLSYLEGLCKLYRLDDDANVPIQYFLDHFEGRHYIKEAYLKLAYFHFVQGDLATYEASLSKVLASGRKDLDADKNAHKEASTAAPLNAALLKSRLLYDGSFLDRAEAVLATIELSSLTSDEQRVEYQYRKARIAEGKEEWDLAIQFYKKTMEDAAGMDLYFPAKSALQIGLIYEGQGNWAFAKTYFERCISYKGHEFKNSFDQQARAGLSRLKGK